MRVRFNCRGRLLAVILVCLSAGVSADEETGWSHNYIPPEQWKESTVEIPRWPEENDLLEVSIGRGGDTFRYYIDPESLTVSDDLVVRYVLVIVSSSGAWNTSFEGILCGKAEYRRYAYGSGGQWHELGESAWRSIADDGRYSYRDSLYRNYLCSMDNSGSGVREILQRIRYKRDSYPYDD